MKLAVIGSRTIKDYIFVENKLCEIIEKYNEIDTIISGGAKGVDSLAEKFANEYGLKTIIFKPDWKKFGKGAGFIRNKQIIENSDIVVAFWDGKSNGTKHSIELAKKMNKKLIVFKKVNNLNEESTRILSNI